MYKIEEIEEIEETPTFAFAKVGNNSYVITEINVKWNGGKMYDPLSADSIRKFYRRLGANTTWVDDQIKLADDKFNIQS
jgi:hypothetical protein